MSADPWPRVTVIGAGVIGITSAVCLLEKYPKCHLTVCSEKFSPNTTGDGAAGLWEPFRCPGTSQKDIIRWSKATWDVYLSWWRCGQKGIRLVQTKNVSKTVDPLPYWKDIPYDMRELTDIELTNSGKDNCKSGFMFSTLMAEPKIFLPVLMNKLKEMGASFKQIKFVNLTEASLGADLVINCCGIGARELVPDHSVFPIRGQIFMVEAPWVKQNLMADTDQAPTYILVNEDAVVVGGTTQDDNWSRSICPNDSHTIWRNALQLAPELKEAKILGQWVGLRPGRRAGVRLEKEYIRCGSKQIPIIHNYGHGGCGITLAWGCANDVAELAFKEMVSFQTPKSRI